MPSASIRLKASIIFELYRLHETRHLLWAETKPAKLARVIQQTKSLRVLADRRKVFQVYDAFAWLPNVKVVSFRTLFGLSKRAPWVVDGGHRTLSVRAFGRVWTSVAEAWLSREPEDFHDFVTTFRKALIAAVEREARFAIAPPIHTHAPPSTSSWVHSFFLHTGLSPPEVAKLGSASGGRISRNTGLGGGLNGPVRRPKAAGDLPVWPHGWSACGRVRRNPAKARDIDRYADVDGHRPRWRSFRHKTGANRNDDHPGLGDKFSVVGRRWGLQLAA
jgi:hypothetical protein